jgi:hypothetical protein
LREELSGGRSVLLSDHAKSEAARSYNDERPDICFADRVKNLLSAKVRDLRDARFGASGHDGVLTNLPSVKLRDKSRKVSWLKGDR